MSEYVHYTPEEKRRANNVDLEQLLLQHGETLIPAGREKRLASNHSITIRKNCWYDHAEETGGLAIDFVKMYYQMTFSEATAFLLSAEGMYHIEPLAEPAERERKKLVLPEVNRDMKRLYAYLVKKRCIEPEVVNFFVKEKLLYESREENKTTGKVYQNAIFVGRDADGIARHAHKKGLYSDGTSYRGNLAGSEPEYSFQYRGKGNKVYVFEAPIDLMSYITLHPDNWQQHSYIALMGVSGKALMQFLLEREDTETIVFCLDNDDAGNQAIQRLTAEVQAMNKPYRIEIDQSITKDWNEDLQSLNEPIEEQEMVMAT
ncbi:MAG: DUF3991 and TOPRIM domain-containing protein [Peptococcaceae bacterium]|nr:DUF3991 and TOPRIM domain-containing protein [Peptococcaceae bacterium]